MSYIWYTPSSIAFNPFFPLRTYEMKKKVFISWSGDVSQEVATALEEWLPAVIQSTNPWMSAHDINVGSFWNPEVISALEECKAGILCLTPDNIDSNWLLFEAGALTKSLSSACVCPYLIGVSPSELEAPLSIFQAATADYEGTLKLCQAINQSMSTESQIPLGVLNTTFRQLWPVLYEKIEKHTTKWTADNRFRDIEIINDPGVRTSRIVEDLNLLEKQIKTGTAAERQVRYSGFLSSFAIDSKEFSDPDDEYNRSLVKEREGLVGLAELGCQIRCVVTPPTRDDLIESLRPHAITRLEMLQRFLEDNTQPHHSIAWVLSPFRQKNQIIVGSISCFEGFKKMTSSGYHMTLRQASRRAVDSSKSIFDSLFEHLKINTAVKKYDEQIDPDQEYNEFSRLCVLSAIKRSLRELIS